MELKQIDFARFDGKITKKELQCQCGKNHEDYINIEFLDQLFQARLIANVPFIFSSVCRCYEHNQKCGGKYNSSHISTDGQHCCAADILVQSNENRWKIMEGLIKAGFKRIGIAKSFIHVDNDKNKVYPRIWMYKDK
jgi:zinc D-Ala-D-Ala carboxypeptidase